MGTVTEVRVVAEFHVYMQDGRNETYQGKELMLRWRDQDDLVLILLDSVGQGVVFDPLCAVEDKRNGMLVYHPNIAYDFLNDKQREWLLEHPEWPKLLEIPGDPGSFPDLQKQDDDD